MVFDDYSVAYASFLISRTGLARSSFYNHGVTEDTTRSVLRDSVVIKLYVVAVRPSKIRANL